MERKVRKLPPQLVSLIHHVALNEIGWWDKTIQRFIISTIWLADNISNTDKINEALKNDFNLHVELVVIEKEINKLIGQGVVIRIDKSNFKLTEKSLAEFEKELKEFESLENDSEKGFHALIGSYCPTLDKADCWQSFIDKLLIPLVHELGAKTYELISGQTATIEQSTKFQNYLLTFPTEVRDGIRGVIIDFFNPKNRTYRNFILRKINAYFCLEAGNLSEESLQRLTSITKKNINFILYLDTNFLFSILGLHENPSNEAAVSLKTLIDKIENKINVKLYVLPPTIREAGKVLSYHVDLLEEIRFTKNMVEASRKFNFSGFAKKFFNEVQRTNKYISAKEYFDPYIKNLVTAIRPHGVELFNKDLDKYSTDQRVIDDLTDRLKYEERIFKDKAKNYEQLLHDIILWYFNKDQRPAVVESPIDAKNWIVTVDFRFLGFDSFKRKQSDNNLTQICIHPASLIQMLQFWTPRTEEFEEAIISNIRTPFLSNEFNLESEKITIKILETLSRFEDLEDLSEETISGILLNDALRQRINSVRDVEEQIDLVKDAIIEQNNRIKEEAEREKQRANELANLVENKESEIGSLQKTISDLEVTRTEGERKAKDLESRINQIEKERESERKFVAAEKKYMKEKAEFINNKWNEYKKEKNVFWYFLVVLICLAFGIYLIEIFLLKDLALKVVVPSLFFVATLVLSFFNRDRILKSFGLIFRDIKVKNREIAKYTKEFTDRTKYPTLKDFA